MEFVTLETERLILRPWQQKDIGTYARICADPEVMRFLGGRPYTPMEAWRHMAFLIGHWVLRGYSHWAVEERSSGTLIGRLGFLEPDDYPGFEIGWTLARESWGKGYATEGAKRALEYGFTELNRAHVISLIDPDNHASIAVAKRLGEVLEGQVKLWGQSLSVYGISREQWRSGIHA